jgi:hypothetical protein
VRMILQVHCCSEDCIKLVRVAKISRVANHKFIFELPSASQWILRRWNRRSAIDLLFQTRLVQRGEHHADAGPLQPKQSRRKKRECCLSFASRSLATALFEGALARGLLRIAENQGGGQFLMSSRGQFRMSLDKGDADLVIRAAINVANDPERRREYPRNIQTPWIDNKTSSHWL